VVGPLLTRRDVVIGLGLIALLVGIAVIGPVLAGDPYALDIDRGLDTRGAPLGPRSGAWLGSDPLGRDVLARIVTGAGTSLWIAAVATALALIGGVAVGAIAGIVGGRIDAALMRLVDLALAFPFLLLAILLAALLRQAELPSQHAPVFIPLAVVGWTTVARVVRAKTLVLARSEFVLAAQSLGASTTRLIVRHVLPNIAGVIVVASAFMFAQNLLGEATLSFLGLGPPPPAPTWGRMLYEGRAYYRSAPWLVVAPGVAIVTAVLACNLVGQALRERFTPRTELLR
jgi:ABC-type dipeptide/oligopeptide/nickel transport system permease subunit